MSWIGAEDSAHELVNGPTMERLLVEAALDDGEIGKIHPFLDLARLFRYAFAAYYMARQDGAPAKVWRACLHLAEEAHIHMGKRR